MAGLEAFRGAILKAAQPIALGLMEREGEEYNEAFRNHLFDLNGPRETKASFSREELLILRLLRGFSEISDTYDSLEDIELYVRRFPFRMEAPGYLPDLLRS